MNAELEQTLASNFPLDIAAIETLAHKAGSKIVTLQSPGLVGVPAEIPVLVDPGKGTVVDLSQNFERYRTAPARKLGVARTLTLVSFVELTKYHAIDTSVIFANTDWTKPSFLAVIDYHQATDGEVIGKTGEAKFGKHRVQYDFPLSEEWKAWIGVNGTSMKQGDFAEWIEDHIGDLSEPTPDETILYSNLFKTRVAFPNEMMALSRGLSVFTEKKVKQNIVLQSGEGQLTFEEEHRDQNGNKIDVPGIFILSIAPFYAGDPARIPVRLRYRVIAGGVTWMVILYRPEHVITDKIIKDLDFVSQETLLPVFEGAPEMQG